MSIIIIHICICTLSIHALFMYCLKLTDVTPKSKTNLTIRQKEEFKEHYDKNNVIIMLNILVQNGIFFKLDQRLMGSTIYF